MNQSLNEIECFSKLLALLISMKFSLTLQERMVLQSYLCPEIKDGIEQVGFFRHLVIVPLTSFLFRDGKKLSLPRCFTY